VLQQASRTLPLVFANATNPVGNGLVAGLEHPGGNATGFMVAEFGVSRKSLQLLKQIAASVTPWRSFDNSLSPASAPSLLCRRWCRC
jgi:putative ABC transport system substrate-binding protein